MSLESCHWRCSPLPPPKNLNKNLSISIFSLPSHPLTRKTDAQMAKLVDALCSGRSARKGVLVRIQFWAHKRLESH
jgi:hypothetical protein